MLDTLAFIPLPNARVMNQLDRCNHTACAHMETAPSATRPDIFISLRVSSATSFYMKYGGAIQSYNANRRIVRN